MLIDVVNPGHVRRVVIDDCSVVNVGHLSHVDSRVGDVHIVDIARTGSIPGHVNFARSQREPGHAGADADSSTETSSAHEGDQRGRIHRAHVYRTWHPAPGTFHECPTSVVEGSETPRFVFNPGPAPGRDPNPVAISIRSPSRSNCNRCPHRTVVRRIVPVTVLVEIRCARHLG